MRIASTPVLGPAYWAALSAASVFGADCGDCVSHVLGLGHVRGVPVLLACFALTLAAEARSRRGGVAFYWIAIVLLRTVATNLADLMTHDWRLGYGVTALLLALLLAGTVARAGRRRGAVHRGGSGAEPGRPDGGTMPAVDASYWLAMGIAGTLGTVCGDGLSAGLRLGAGAATLLLVPAAAALFATRAVPSLAGKRGYWAVVATVRTIGTTFGDWSADGIGLVPATAASGMALLALAAVGRRLVARAATAEAPSAFRTVPRGAAHGVAPTTARAGGAPS